mmetsp:Transcript_109887/g.218267  ORF Transcript_109887/g.218267 Transcript_109887/m.218267 type:complete len:84 (-) Transcript_109887:279-530(-)
MARRYGMRFFHQDVARIFQDKKPRTRDLRTAHKVTKGKRSANTSDNILLCFTSEPHANKCLQCCGAWYGRLARNWVGPGDCRG